MKRENDRKSILLQDGTDGAEPPGCLLNTHKRKKMIYLYKISQRNLEETSY